MFLKDSIGPVLEEIWQLAMTLASLKHIAGVLSHEMDAGQTLEGRKNINFMLTPFNLFICLDEETMVKIGPTKKI